MDSYNVYGRNSASQNFKSSNPSLVGIGRLKDDNIIRDISAGNGQYRSDCAVFIRDVHKRYEHGPSVLKNFCMSVKKGTIYGLLGSSGCGKTTILSCIVGLQKCDSGEILVFGREPGTKGSGIPGKKSGYMPQDLALYHHLTSREIIRFYGKLYGMTSRQIEDQWDFLNMLLQLPSNSTIIGDLSGGQQRRVSLALTLIHSPELLILDEPVIRRPFHTVGLDPLLRTDIWNYLYQIVRKLGTTIIITTHYIEEARNSNTIGVMRNGRLLAQESPSKLLRDYNCELLEQVVLQLCRKDNRTETSFQTYEQDSRMLFMSCWNGSSDADANNDDSEDKPENGQHFKPGRFDGRILEQLSRNVAEKHSHNRSLSARIKRSRICQALRRVYAFVSVLLMTFVRNPVFLWATLFMPCIQGSLTLLCVGSKPRGTHLGIVNPEMLNWTTECDSAIHTGNSCDLTTLSCKFLNRLKSDDMVVLSPYDSEYDALSQSHLGRISGYITFPENYSQHSLSLFTERQFSSNESIEGSRIHAHLDYSQRIQVLLTIKHLFTSYFLYIRELATSCHIGGEQAEYPINFRPPVFGKEDDYTTFIIPGLILVSIGAIAFSLVGIMVIADRKQGTLSRAHVAGLTISDVLSSHLIVQSIVAIGEIVIWHLILYFGFGFESVGAPWIMVLYCLVTRLCGSALGILMGQIFMDEMNVLCMAILLFTIFIQFASAIFPKELMSTFWMNFSYLIPTTLGTQALRAVTIHGTGWMDPRVWGGLLVLIGWSAGMLFISVLIYKKFNK